MKFDPITGEVIEEVVETPVVPQPNVTPESVQPESIPQVNAGFDPMTGQPIVQQSAPQPNTIQPNAGFDPMTGQPIVQQSTPQPNATQPNTGFDPMTGQPIVQQSAPQPNTGFDPMTGQPITEKAPKKKADLSKLLIPGIIVAAVAVIAVIVTVVIKSGIFLGANGKVFAAVEKTFAEQPKIAQDLKPVAEILTSDKYTIGVTTSVDKIDLAAELRNGGNQLQVYGKIDSKDGEISALAGIHSGAFKLQVPELDDRVFLYDSNNDNSGILMDSMSDEDIEMIDSLLQEFGKTKVDVSAFGKEVTGIVMAEMKALEFEKTDEKSFRINKERRDCKGYMAEITSDNLVHIAEGIEELINKEYSDIVDMLAEAGTDLSDVFADLYDELEDFDEVYEISFYIYKGQLAGICLEMEDSDGEIELAFKGGDYRMQNIEFKENDNTVLELKGSLDDTEESFEIKVNGSSNSMFEITYDNKSGEFKLEAAGYSVEGKLESKASEVNVTLDRVRRYGESMGISDLSITLSKSAKMDKYSGKEFDLGNADEDEFMDLAEDLQDSLEDNDMEGLVDMIENFYYYY